MTITLNICTTLATAMGPQINRHLKTLGAGIFSTLADAKVSVNNIVKPPLTGTCLQWTLFLVEVDSLDVHSLLKGARSRNVRQFQEFEH